MRGNNYYQRKELMEDEIIKHIDMSRRIKAPRPVEVLLRVPIIEIIAHKASVTGRALRLGAVG